MSRFFLVIMAALFLVNANTAAATVGGSASKDEDYLKLKSLFEAATEPARIGDFPEALNSDAYKCAYVGSGKTASASQVPLVIFRVTRVEALPDRGPLFPATPAVVEPIVIWKPRNDQIQDIQKNRGANIKTERIQEKNKLGSVLRTTVYYADDFEVTSTVKILIDMKVAGGFVLFHELSYLTSGTPLDEYYGYCWKSASNSK